MMNTKKSRTIRWLSVALVLLTLVSFSFSVSYAEPASKDKANYILLYCLSTDTMLYEKNTDMPLDPGYTAQMMTALLALEYDPDLNKTVTLFPNLLTSWDFPQDYRAYTYYGFQKGATVLVKDLLAAMMLENSTAAATLLAATIGGSVENFVEMMNARALELGMEHTVFTNPTGIASSSATSTLQDLFKLTTLLYQNSRYMDLASAPSFQLANQAKAYTRNYLIGKWFVGEEEKFYYDAKATGMKTDSAFDRNQKRKTTMVIATAKENDGNHYLAMVMGGQGEYEAYNVAKDFFKWGSTDFRSLKVIAREKLYKHLPVDGGDRTSQVPIFPEKDMTAFLPSSVTLDDITYKYSLTQKELEAPLEYGTKVGEIQAFVGDKMVASCNLIVGQNLAQSKDSQMYGVFGSILLSPFVLIGLFILILYMLIKVGFFVWALSRLRKFLKHNKNKKRIEK